MGKDILIVDDEADICRMVADILGDEGYEVRKAFDGPQAIDAIAARRPSLVLLDIWLGDSRFDGLKVLEVTKKDHPDLPVLMMSGHGTIETAVSAIKKGAYDFIEKPFKADRLLLAIHNAIETARLRAENSELKNMAPICKKLSGGSAVTSQIRQLIEKVGPTSSRVMISGPAGSGKEIVARSVHESSRRSEGQFLVLNCVKVDHHAIEEDLFGIDRENEHKVGALEKAHLGTLYLDEVSDLPIEAQGKLVRALQSNTFQRVGGTRKVTVDVRVLASTTKDLKEMVNEGKFREDLYYRLNVVPINVPSLSGRRDDIPDLAIEFMEQAAKAKSVSPLKFSQEALLALQSYNWPGNVRQLKNVIDWLLIMFEENAIETISPEMLPAEISVDAPAILQNDQSQQLIALPLREAREKFERDYLLAQVARFSGNISQTANFVGMERSALHRKLKNLQIERGGKNANANENANENENIATQSGDSAKAKTGT